LYGNILLQTCKAVLFSVSAIYLELRKIVVQKVIVVEFEVDNESSDRAGCFVFKANMQRSSRIWILKVMKSNQIR